LTSRISPKPKRPALVATSSSVDLLVLEDFGMKKLGASAAEDLLETFVRRHEAGSTLITTNRPTQDWGARNHCANGRQEAIALRPRATAEPT
jgi:DNA replication protein DnaC